MSMTHAKLLERLSLLTKEARDKSAENPSEEILSTSHPSGSESADSDGTTDVVTGELDSQNTATNKEMNPKGTESGTKNEPGKEQTDPGNNKGLKPRPTGEAPEVEKAYTVGKTHDPGTSHPVGKAASIAKLEDLSKESSALSEAIRALIKTSGEDTKEDKTEAKEANSGSQETEESPKADEAPEDQATKIASMSKEARIKLAEEARQTVESLKQAGEQEAEGLSSLLAGIVSGYVKKAEGLPMVPEEEDAPQEEAEAAEAAEAEAALEAMMGGAPEGAPLGAPIEGDMVGEDPLEALLAGGGEGMDPGAPGAGEELTPEEEQLLMMLLEEGINEDDAAAYGKLASAVKEGHVKQENLSKVQLEYYKHCHKAIKSAVAKCEKEAKFKKADWKATLTKLSSKRG